MVRNTWLGLAAAAVSGTALASGPVAFEGDVWMSGGAGIAFDEHIPAGQTRSMRLGSGQQVEMSVAPDGTPTVRLLDRAGTVLHSAQRTAGTPGPWAFRYALCRKGAVAYSSPPEGDRTGCR